MFLDAEAGNPTTEISSEQLPSGDRSKVCPVAGFQFADQRVQIFAAQHHSGCFVRRFGAETGARVLANRQLLLRRGDLSAEVRGRMYNALVNSMIEGSYCLSNSQPAELTSTNTKNEHWHLRIAAVGRSASCRTSRFPRASMTHTGRGNHGVGVRFAHLSPGHDVLSVGTITSL